MASLSHESSTIDSFFFSHEPRDSPRDPPKDPLRNPHDPPRDGSFSQSSTNNGRKGTARWPRPLCLVESIDGTMKLNSDTLARLRAVKESVVVVAIVGLYRTGKSYLMNRLSRNRTDNSKMTTSDPLVVPGVRSLDGLDQVLECQYGLLTELKTRGVLTDRQIKDIQRPNSTVYEQNTKLIEFITPVLTDKNKYLQFITSLQETGQRHVAKKIAGNIDPLDDDRPLSEDELARITVNTVFLVDSLEIKYGLLEQLYSSNVITKRHLQSVTNQGAEYKQTEELLDILQRRSFSQFQKFVRCLKVTEQHHVYPVFDSKGGIPSLFLQLIQLVLPVDAPVEKEMEDVLIARFRLMSQADQKRFVEKAFSDVELLDIQPHHSIRLYFLCHSLEALQSLRDLVESGQLGTMIESYFNSLLSDTQFFPVHLQNLHLVDNNECEQCFIEYHGFDLGNTVQAKTKGIWIWCIIHPTRRDHCLLLMDTEGLGDIERGDTQFDTMLFVTATLLSSTLVYNSKGVIDYDAIDKLHVVTELADRIKIKKDENLTDDGEISQYFPKFVWALRDFHLDLEVDGRVLSADQYLDEHALKKKKGIGRKIHDLNRTLDCIKGYFPIRKCFPFPPPVIHSKMSMLDKLSNDDLSQTFRERSKEFCDYIYNESLPKCLAGVVLDGQKLASIAQHYIETMLAGGVPCMESAYLATANAVNHAALIECVAHYERGMSTLVLPTPDEQTLRAHNTRYSEESTVLFSQQIMAVYESEKLAKELSDAISSKYQAIVERNEQESEQKCREVAQKLFQPIQTKIDAGSYSNIGGYLQFQQEIEAAYRTYQEMPGKGVKALHVQQEYVAKFSELGTVIMVADKALSDKEKMQEEERQKLLVLAGQIKRLKAEKEYSERLRADQEKLQQEFQAAMQAQIALQARTHQEYIARIEQQSVQASTHQAQINLLMNQKPMETINYREIVNSWLNGIKDEWAPNFIGP